MKKILAIHGILGSGKDTVVSIIKMHLTLQKLMEKQSCKESRITLSLKNQWLDMAVREKDNESWCNNILSYDIERFAKPLKAVIAAFIGCTTTDLNSQEFKKLELDATVWYSIDKPSMSIRDLHTDISDGIKQAINNRIFASTCLERCKHSKADLVIINDLRYPFELDACIINNAYLLKIQRPEADKARDENLKKNGEVHSSEQQLDNDDFNQIIRNDSTYDDLTNRIVDVLLDAQLVSNRYVKWYKNN